MRMWKSALCFGWALGMTWFAVYNWQWQEDIEAAQYWLLHASIHLVGWLVLLAIEKRK